MKKIILISNLVFGAVNVSAAAISEIMPPLPAGNPDKIWADYCVGNRNSADIPRPNYQNKEILSAVKKLAMVSPYSFYFYSGPLYAYNLRVGKELVEPGPEFPENIQEVKNGRKNANAFMTLLCGEFRDRPSLIKEKIRWVNRMYTLPAAAQKPINIKHELWSQVSAHSYKPYLENSKAIFNAKKLDARKYNIKLGNYSEDVPVEPFTVCETKFIFKKFVETKSVFEYRNFGKYKTEYKKFKSRCSVDDLNHIYDFRGDSNFKPNSPESNGMIWYSSTITNNCTRTKDGQYVLKTASKEKISDATICEKYATNPFAYRWSAARAGLATWMLRDEKHDAVFSAEGESIYIVPNLDPTAGPFGFKMPLKDEFYMELQSDHEGKYFKWDENYNVVYLSEAEVEVEKAKIAEAKALHDQKLANSHVVKYDFVKEWNAKKEEFWKRPDLGFNQLTGLGTAKVNKNLAYERLRDAVNRHTDWYSSGYDDGFGILRDQAYSPFVASSYEMSASDGFTAPGVTVQSPADGCKHWMFVFKLKKDQWYNTQSVQNKVPINFNYHWFDETSFGTNHLADTEHAFDRLGTALEGEMDVILYLHKLTTNGEVNEQCGYEQMGLTTQAEVNN